MRLSLFYILMTGVIFFSSIANAKSRPGDIEAEKLVERFTAEMVAVLTDKKNNFSQRSDALHKILLRDVDRHKIVLFTLGRYARKIKRDQFPKYMELIEDYAVRLFISNILYVRNADKAKITVIKSQKRGGRGREVIVFSKLEVSSLKQPINIKWWLVKNKKTKKFKLFNLGVEGFWLAQEQRSQFAAFIQKNGGDPKVLLPYLREKIKQTENQNKARDIDSLRKNRAQ